MLWYLVKVDSKNNITTGLGLLSRRRIWAGKCIQYDSHWERSHRKQHALVMLEVSACLDRTQPNWALDILIIGMMMPLTNIRSIGSWLHLRIPKLQDMVRLVSLGECSRWLYIDHSSLTLVTEKLVLPFLAGAIPIYWGDSGIATSVFNAAAFIDCSDLSIK